MSKGKKKQEMTGAEDRQGKTPEDLAEDVEVWRGKTRNDRVLVLVLVIVRSHH